MTSFRYNQIVQRFLSISITARLILLGIFILALNPSAQPHLVRQDWTLTRLALESGQPGVAYASLDRIALAYPWRTDLRLAAARYALQAGEWVQGIQWMGLLPPASLSADDWLQLGDAYQAHGDLRMAEQAWKQSLSLEPGYAGYERLYAIHRLQNDLIAIKEDLQNLAPLRPNDQVLAFQLTLHLAAFDPSAAATRLEQSPITDENLKPKAIQLERKLKAALLADQLEVQFAAAGQALAELQEWRLAIAAFRQALQINPNYAEAWSFLGEARQHLDPPETEQALIDLRQGLSLKPDSVVAISTLALYWQRQGDLSRAADLYRSVVARDANNPTWFAALAGIANASGELQIAEWYYQQAIDLAPEEAVYWRLLANFYILNQIQVREKALPAAQQAVELEPSNPSNLDTLGQALLLLDEGTNARASFVKALEIDPKFAPAHLHLGIAELFDGQTERAHQHLQAARDLALDKATADQAERLLSYYFP